MFIVGVIGYQIVDEWGTVKLQFGQVWSFLAFGLPLIPVVVGSMTIAVNVADFLAKQRSSNEPTTVAAKSAQIIKDCTWPYVIWITIGVLGILVLQNFTLLRGQVGLVLLICVFAILGVGGLTFIVKYFSTNRA